MYENEKIPMELAEIRVKIYKYCAYQDRCRQEIEQKFRDWEVPEQEWEDLLAHLEAERFWDEGRFAESFAGGKFRVKKWGKQKIRHELRAKGIPGYLIELAIRREIPEEAYSQTAQGLVEKKRKELGEELTYEIRGKIYRFMQQKGYENEVIRSLLT